MPAWRSGSHRPATIRAGRAWVGEQPRQVTDGRHLDIGAAVPSATARLRTPVGQHPAPAMDQDPRRGQRAGTRQSGPSYRSCAATAASPAYRHDPLTAKGTSKPLNTRLYVQGAVMFGLRPVGCGCPAQPVALAAISFAARVLTGTDIAWNKGDVWVIIAYAVWAFVYFAYF